MVTNDKVYVHATFAATGVAFLFVESDEADAEGTIPLDFDISSFDTDNKLPI
eukprot:Awhi_evm1s7121